MRREQRDIFAAAAQRRQVDGDDVEPVVEIFAEPAFAHRLAQVDIGGGDDADVDLDLLNAAKLHEAAVLQHAQDLCLRVHTHRADFVQEERAPVGDLRRGPSWWRWLR